MHSYQIVQIDRSTTPLSIKVLGDYTAVFNGKFYRNSAGQTLPFYTAADTTSYTLIPATSFIVTNNVDYAGTYTVYTPTSATDTVSSSFDGTYTRIYVNETDPVSSGTPNTTSGTITNCTTYLIDVAGESSIAVPPKVVIDTRPISLFGRSSTPWGEDLVQVLVDSAQNFAAAVAPTSPLLGQSWFDTTTESLKFRTSSGWTTVAVSSKYRAHITTAAQTWSISHNLNLAAPYIALTQVFVDTPNGIKMIIPSDISFVDANTMTISFTTGTSYTGYVLIQA